LWGVDLPLKVPRDLSQAALNALHHIRVTYWRHAGGYARACGQLSAFLGELAAWAHGHGSPPMDAPAQAQPDSPLLREALQLLDDPKAAPTSIQTAAEMLGVSRQHLARLARRHLGRSLQDIVQARRRHMATRLLLETGLSVRRIAGDLGYRQVPSFIRAFRRWYGLSPSEFRATRRR
jgi:AraC-like DNA-binding protein